MYKYPSLNKKHMDQEISIVDDEFTITIELGMVKSLFCTKFRFVVARVILTAFILFTQNLVRRCDENLIPSDVHSSALFFYCFESTILQTLFEHFSICQKQYLQYAYLSIMSSSYFTLEEFKYSAACFIPLISIIWTRFKTF